MKSELNFDREVRKKVEAIGLSQAAGDWSRMEPMLDEVLPTRADISFDQAINDKIANLEIGAQADWSRMSEALESELGIEDSNFDDLIASKVLQFNPKESANWNKMSQALDKDGIGGKSAHLFDRQVKRALAGFVAMSSEPRWDDMSFALDADPVLGDAQAFDDRVKREIEYTVGSGIASESWPRMEQQLQSKELHRKRILQSKFAELAAVFLLLLCFPGLFTLFSDELDQKSNAIVDQIKEQSIESLKPEEAPSTHAIINESAVSAVNKEEKDSQLASASETNEAAVGHDQHRKSLSESMSLVEAVASKSGETEPSKLTKGEVAEAGLPALEGRTEQLRKGDSDRKMIRPFTYMKTSNFISENKVPPRLQGLQPVNAAAHQSAGKIAPLVYVSIQGHHRYHEYRVSPLMNKAASYHNNQIQAGLALGVTNGLWDVELGVLPYSISHNGLPGQHAFVDYVDEGATYKRKYLSSEIKGLIVPLKGRYHMPLNDKLSMHALGGLNGTFLTESEQVFQEQFHDWIDDNPQGGSNRPDRVVRVNDKSFFVDAELGLGMNYQWSPRWRIFAEGSTFIPLEGTRTIGENADEYHTQYGLTIGLQFLFK